MAVFVAVMAGENARKAEPVFASSDPVLISAVANWVKGALGPQPVSEILADEGFQGGLSDDVANAVREGVSGSEEPELKPAT